MTAEISLSVYQSQVSCVLVGIAACTSADNCCVWIGS